MFLEHDPPGHAGTSCFASRHPLDDPDVTIVHVTHFNDLMWDTGESPTTVIEHDEVDPGDLSTGDLAQRGSAWAGTCTKRCREVVPLDLVGLGFSTGAGRWAKPRPTKWLISYRLFFHPTRYTTLGLALCEAMMMPAVVLASTEIR